jgi:transposase-like protein
MSGSETGLPGGLPAAVRRYLDHTGGGLSIRALARREGVHASTILRQVRRFEARREDPLVDAAIDALAAGRPARAERQGGDCQEKDKHDMAAPIRPDGLVPDEATVIREARRILRRLAEPGAILAIAPDMEKAAVLREMPDGTSARTAVTDRAVAQAFALRDWIACRRPGRVAAYGLTGPGRAALRRMLDPAGGLAEAPAPFAGQHRSWGERTVPDAGGTPRRLRCLLSESPVAVLARRREKDGKPFLPAELVAAAERLHEDFELAQTGPRLGLNWDRFLTAGIDRSLADHGPPGLAGGAAAARDRVAAALRDLGPGLGDVALRVCCYMEGVEATERRLGWSARSGKIVLRIALIRLRRHYDETYRGGRPLIG